MKRTFLKSAAVALAISALSLSSTAAQSYHHIEKGDTLWRTSQKYGMTVEQLKEINNLTSNQIYAGEKLAVSKIIKVKKGDTLWSLANKHRTTVQQLKHVNRLKSDTIFIEQKLEIPTVVLIRSGDTLWGISQRYGISVESLKRNNGLKSNVILAGQILKVNQIPHQTTFYNADKVLLSLQSNSAYSFSPEEPRTFILQHNRYETYFARVEVLSPNADIKTVRTNSAEQLKTIGEVTELNTKNSLPFYKDAQFFLHTHNTHLQMIIGVKNVNGKLLKFTLHYPNLEEAEGEFPEMLEMLHKIKIK
ncbi:MAG: LysM peptidoglycan-binding domain-containing protein [Bacillota bacterium]